MADTKITALAAITTVDPAADVLPIVDISDTSMAASGTTKKITSNQILGAGGTATLASATITGDLTVRSGNKLILNRADNAISTQLNDAGSGAGFTVNNLNGDGILLKVASNDVYRINSSYVQTWFDGAGGTRMTLNSTGLGVGVTSPNAKLHINGNLKIDGATSEILMATGAERTISASGTSGSTALTFKRWDGVSAYINDFILSGSGNVGVGVTPTYKITIGGDGSSAACTLAFIDTSNSNKEFRIDQSVSELRFIESGNSTPFRIKDSNVVVSEAAIATTATKGFLYIPTCAGTPTGTPATFTGRSPIVVDSTNNKLYFYSGGSWVAAN